MAPEPRDQASRDCFLPLMTRDRLVVVQYLPTSIFFAALAAKGNDCYVLSLYPISLGLCFTFRSLLPVHFLTKAESGREEQMMRDWMDVLVTESGFRQVPYLAAVSLSLHFSHRQLAI